MMIPLSCVICFSYSKMEDLETQRKYKSVRMRLGYDWNTNRKKEKKMQQRRKIRYTIAFFILIAGIFVLLFCNIGIGTVKFHWQKF